MFKDVDLHKYFPNLNSLHLELGREGGSPILIPNLAGCELLQSLTVKSNRAPWEMAFQSHLEEKESLS